MKVMRRLIKLEHFKDHTTNKKGLPNADFSFNQGFSNPPKIPRIKSLEMVTSAPREWFLNLHIKMHHPSLGLI